MKRGGFLKRKTGLRVVGHFTSSEDKREIQRLVREIVIARDEGCILRAMQSPCCNGYANDGHLILQADHLISRGNSATFADTRLIVCLCKGHHGWKSVGSNLRKAQYDEIVRRILPKDRVALWRKCEKESWRAVKMDWKLEIVALKQELQALTK